MTAPIEPEAALLLARKLLDGHLDAAVGMFEEVVPVLNRNADQATMLLTLLLEICLFDRMPSGATEQWPAIRPYVVEALIAMRQHGFALQKGQS